MAGAMLLSFAACGSKGEEETTTAAEETTVAEVAGEAENEKTPEADDAEEVTEEDEEATEEDETEAEEKDKKDDKEDKEDQKEENKADDASKWSKAEIIEYANVALNKVKSSKAGFTKRGVMNINGDVSGLPSWLTSIFKKDNTEKFAKGTDTTDVFPAAGYSWSCKLRPQDVESAKIKVNGTNYEIEIKLGVEKNPGKGTSSSYGRAVSVIDAAEAANMVSGLKSVDMTYHDGYIKITVDSRTGNISYAEISATADAKANVAIIGDVQAKDIKSTEYYTNFVW